MASATASGTEDGSLVDVFGATEPTMPRRLDLGRGPPGRARRYSSYSYTSCWLQRDKFYLTTYLVT